MRIRLAIVSGAVLVLTAGTGAAYAVVGHSTVSPTVTGNVLPLDDNHSSTTARQSGDDRGGRPSTAASPTTEAGDDRGAATAEPADDRGAATAEPGDDRNRGRGTDDATTAPTRTGVDDSGHGRDGAGHS